MTNGHMHLFLVVAVLDTDNAYDNDRKKNALGDGATLTEVLGRGYERESGGEKLNGQVSITLRGNQY